MDALLTYATLVLIAYAVLRKVGLIRYPFPARELAGRVKAFAAQIPWTPPQAKARQQAKAPVTLRPSAIRQAEHRYRMERIAAKRRWDGHRDGRTEAGRTPDAHDITKLRAEIEADVWQQVRAQIKDRQRESLDTYLAEKWQRVDDKGKARPVRREDIYGLMGMRDDDVRELIKQLEEIRRLRSLPPTPPELAKMEPLPTR